MKSKSYGLRSDVPQLIRACLLLLPFVLRPAVGTGQEFTRAQYRLMGGSTLTEGCVPCAGPTVAQPLRGTFELVFLESNPLNTTYAVTNLQFTSLGAERRTLTGHGIYTTGGEVAIQQQMTLLLSRDGAEPVLVSTEVPRTDKAMPLIEVELRRVAPGSNLSLVFDLLAAPVREVWFSTTTGFTSSTGGPRGSGGDLLSSDGAIVQSVTNIVAALGLPAAAFPVQLDAIDVQPGGEIWFSLTENQPVSRFGKLQHGDLLSSRGRIVVRNQELTAGFGIQPVVPDLGLDAIHVMDDGEILFSTTTDVFSERLGRVIRRGDLLSNRRIVLMSNAQLLSRFQPESTDDVGLDAFYLWPTGEIWFSVEQGFQDRLLGHIGAGDLLSSQGIVLERNLDLLAAFSPLEDLADFGLDALYVVTDAQTEGEGSRLTRALREGGSMHLEWQGRGRVFQVLRANAPAGPYEPVSPLLPLRAFDDPLPEDPAGFYRIRQW